MPEAAPPRVHLDLDVTAHIPAHYISADRARIEVYRRIVQCRTIEDLAQLRDDLEDAFGPVPEQASRLLELAEIRVLAGAFGIVLISRRPPDLVFSIDSLAAVDSLFADAPGSVRIPDERTIHLRLAPAYFEQPTLLTVLRKMLGRARVDAGTKT